MFFFTCVLLGLVLIVGILLNTLAICLIKSKKPLDKNSRSYKLASWWTIAACSTISWIFFRILNRTTIHGYPRNIAKLKQLYKNGNCVICSNHISAIDSFCIAVALMYPSFIWDVNLTPISSPKYRPEIPKGSQAHKFLEFVNCVCINVDDPRESLQWFNEVCERLAQQRHRLIFFPEGTRNTGDRSKLQPLKPGAARLVKKAGATFIPIAIRGIENVLPPGRKKPRIGQKIVIYIGNPLSFSPDDRDINQRIEAEMQTALTCANNVLS